MKFLYLDPSASIRLFNEEPHSEALDTWLNERIPDRSISSHLAHAEVLRGLHRLQASKELLTVAQDWLHRAATIALTRPICQAAGDMAPGAQLRSLDAIHVAAATTLGSALTYFVTYDKRQAAAARNQGMAVAMPGIEID